MTRPNFVEGEGQPGPSLARYEEEMVTGTRPLEDATIRLRKTVETRRIDESVPYDVQYGEVERVAPNDMDSGEIETLDDGALSIPVLEEQVVVTKRTVVRERIIVRRRSQTEVQQVTMDLKREHVDVEGPEELIEVSRGSEPTDFSRRHTAPFPGASPKSR